MKIENVIFDFGGVLVEWNPRYLYRDYFENENEMEYFLQSVCTDEWNLQQDNGRSLAEGTRLLQAKFPEYHALIQLYYDKWEQMLKREYPETVAILYQLREKYKVYGLTNWSGETIGIAYKRYPFFKAFDGIVVSGDEKMVKPDKKIYHLLLDRYQLKPANTVFIDDNLLNVIAAKEIGLYAIHYKNPEQLREELSAIKAI